MRRDRMASLHTRSRPGMAQTGGLDPWVVSTPAARLRSAFLGRVLHRAARAARGGTTRHLRRRERTAVHHGPMVPRDGGAPGAA